MEKIENRQSDGILGLDDRFSFGCGSELECFLECCTNVHIWLTPYDIVRMRSAMNMTSGEFLGSYTRLLYPEEAGYPVLMMKLDDDGTGRCPFAVSKGCAVYTDRPWVCRCFPLVPVTGNTRAAAVADGPVPGFEIHKWERCRGIGRGKPVSIREWCDRQGLAGYEEINREWKLVTHHKLSGSRNLLKSEAAKQFYLGCYDIDGFKRFIFAEDFRKEFDVDRNLLKKIASDDTELLKFSFQWLRQVLFGEEVLKRR